MSFEVNASRYCPKCGEFYQSTILFCQNCKIGTWQIPERYNELSKNFFVCNPYTQIQIKRKFQDIFLSKRDTFDSQQASNIIKHQLEEIRNEEIERQIQKEQQTSNLPKCPYCQSTSLKKITTGGRMLSVGFFGLASSKIGKQWHCNNCGSDF